MVLPDGRPKGMKMVLQERGVDTKGMNAQKMRETLSKYLDFASSKTIVQDKIEAWGHVCMFFPKFHYELNTSERNWCHAKKHSRKYSNGSITRLWKIVPEALDTCTPELTESFLEKVGITLELIVKDNTFWNVDKAVKQYKSHRKVIPGNIGQCIS